MALRRSKTRDFKNMVIVVLLLVLAVMTTSVVTLAKNLELESIFSSNDKEKDDDFNIADNSNGGNKSDNNDNDGDNNDADNDKSTDNKNTEKPGIIIDNYQWKVAPVGIKKVNLLGSATEVSAPTFSDSTFTFNVNFINPGDKITYELSIKNYGTIDARLKKIVIVENENSEAILCKLTGISEGQVLKPNKVAKFNVDIEYNSEKQVQLLPGETVTRAVLITFAFVQA